MPMGRGYERFFQVFRCNYVKKNRAARAKMISSTIVIVISPSVTRKVKTPSKLRTQYSASAMSALWTDAMSETQQNVTASGRSQQRHTTGYRLISRLPRDKMTRLAMS